MLNAVSLPGGDCALLCIGSRGQWRTTPVPQIPPLLLVPTVCFLSYVTRTRAQLHGQNDASIVRFSPARRKLCSAQLQVHERLVK